MVGVKKPTVTATPADTPVEADPGLGYVVGRLDRVVRSAIDAVVRDHGVSVNQYTTLSVLARRPLLSNAQLARRSYVSPQSMNETLQALEAMGLIKRRVDPDHARIRRTELTAKGRKLIDRCDDAVGDVESTMTKGFTEREAASLHKLLIRAVQNLGGGLAGS